jgi:Trk K+ transport system NAD-binding subunit
MARLATIRGVALRDAGHGRTRAPRSVVSRLRGGIRGNGGGTARPRYIVCGGGSLAYRLVDELVRRHGLDVTVIQRRRTREDEPDLSTIPGVRPIIANRIDEDVLRAARVQTAVAFALVDQDDVGNIHAALRAHDLNPNVRLVIRLFNRSLGDGFSQLLGDCTILSDADIAAPAFVAAALDEVAPSRFRLRGRSLYVARRSEVEPQDILCGLADLRGDDRPMVLPADARQADMVLAVARGEPRIGTVIAAQRIARSRKRRSPLRFLMRVLRLMVNRKLGIATLAALVVVVACGTALAIKQGYGVWDGVYVALLTAVGGADPETGVGGLVEFLQVALTVAGLALLPLITAAIVEAVVRARLAIAAGRRLEPKQDHLVVVGLGNVGTRVIRQLHDLDLEVIAIDKVDNPRGAGVAEELKIPVIVGDAGDEATLREAFVQDCRALLVLSTDDVTNLQTALIARSLKPDLQVVLRLFEGDLGERIQRAFNITVSRSVSYLAAPEFAAAMMEREVIKTIPVGRHVLLVAEVPVGAGAPLDGARVRAAGRPGNVQVIALTRFGEPGAIWSPLPSQRINAGDRIAVVARRDGLGWLLGQATAPPPPEEIETPAADVPPAHR